MNVIKKRLFPVWASAVLVLVLLVTFGARHYQENLKEKVLLETVVKSLSLMHYDPVIMDDDFSGKVFNEYLNALDFNKKFFLKSDIADLERYKFSIDDDIQKLEFHFFNRVEKVIVERIDDASLYYESILQKPFDFAVDEEIELDAKKSVWCESIDQLVKEWTKGLKYQVMLKVYQELELQESKSDSADASSHKSDVIKKRSLSEIEADAREQVRKTHIDYFDRLKKMTRDDRLGIFLNVIGSVYDPHTNYFPPKIKDDFDISMSGKLEGIGAVLTQRGGYIQVEEIMPGSPSWKQGDLKNGDIILKVAQGSGEPVDVTSMRLDDAVKLIRGKKGTEARLTVKKNITEEVMVISIIRDVVEMEQTWARSAVVNTKEGKRVGYIFLPKFYVDFNNPYTGRNSADDVRKEIIKLKNENIDALVFDLRNNGGGSLQDVVKMAGYFIESGPIVQVKDKLQGLDIMRDDDPEVLYGGPLVVLVNSSSASASEILAAAMQDYQRAVVVGSNSTFGKGTVQRMIDLDLLLDPSNRSLRPLGAIKLTTQKFYRINGGATQLKGVVPDIILPDRYSYIDFGEKDLDNAMAWSKINASSYETWSNPPSDIRGLQKESKVRISENHTFSLIDQQAHRFKQQRDQSSETLHLEKYTAKQRKRKSENEEVNSALNKPTDLVISITNADASVLKNDSVKQRIMNEWIESLSKDLYLEETIHIVHGLTIKKSVGKNNH